MACSGNKWSCVSSLGVHERPMAAAPQGLTDDLPSLRGKHLAAAMERFLSGSASKEEARSVVRHLLARCPGCIGLAQRTLSRSPLLLTLYEVGTPE
jgi:hypothetical protein